MKITAHKNNIINNNALIRSFLPLNKYFIHCHFSKLLITTLYITSIYVMRVTATETSYEYAVLLNSLNESEEAIYSADEQPDTYNYLEKYHKDAPVDIANIPFYTVDDETNILPDDETSILSESDLHLQMEYQPYGLIQPKSKFSANNFSSKKSNGMLSFYAVIYLINQPEVSSGKEDALFDYLLKYYGPLYYRNSNHEIKVLTITVGGMLFDLKQRAKQQDPVATIILAFLRKPWFTEKYSLHQTSAECFSFLDWQKLKQTFSDWQKLKQTFSGWKKLKKISLVPEKLKKIFLAQKKEPSFSEQLTMFSSFVDINQDIRSKRLFSLYRMGYGYEEPSENTMTTSTEPSSEVLME